MLHNKIRTADILHQQKIQTKDAMQSIITLLLDVDRDDNLTIDKNEIEGLFLRLDFMEGVQVEKEKFMAALDEKGYNLGTVLAVLKKQSTEDVAEEEKVILVDVDKIRAASTRQLST